MDAQNAFVARAVRFQKLATPEQIKQAQGHAAERDDGSLLEALKDLGLLREADAVAVLDLYEKGRARQATARPRPVAAPRPLPSSAPRPSPTPEERAVRVADAVSEESPGMEKSAPAAPVAVGQLPPGAERVAAFSTLDEYLSYAREVDASDLHISVGVPPIVRRYGRLIRLPRDPFTAPETETILLSVLDAKQRKRLDEERALDFCLVRGEGDRYRSCVWKQRTGWDGAFRVIGSRVPTLDELGLPEQAKRLTEFPQGLVLVTGPVGCGKSTTMAAMIQLINEERAEHIITLEDPIEYSFVPVCAHINQREVGVHTRSFSAALRAALREDPDVIMVGELRDLETVSLAISAAETGHLVFGSLHTTSAARTIDRLLDVFPSDEQPQIRNMISESIRGIVCQQLLPRQDGQGRALALEIMMNTPGVANMIRERKLFQMPSVLQTGRKHGMVLLDNSLMDLVKQGVIEGRDAYDAADNKGPFMRWAPGGEGA